MHGSPGICFPWVLSLFSAYRRVPREKRPWASMSRLDAFHALAYNPHRLTSGRRIAGLSRRNALFIALALSVNCLALGSNRALHRSRSASRCDRTPYGGKWRLAGAPDRRSHVGSRSRRCRNGWPQAWRCCWAGSTNGRCGCLWAGWGGCRVAGGGIATQLFGPRVGLLSGLIQATCVYQVTYSRLAEGDVLLQCFVLGAISVFLSGEAHGLRPVGEQLSANPRDATRGLLFVWIFWLLVGGMNLVKGIAFGSVLTLLTCSGWFLLGKPRECLPWVSSHSARIKRPRESIPWASADCAGLVELVLAIADARCTRNRSRVANCHGDAGAGCDEPVAGSSFRAGGGIAGIYPTVVVLPHDLAGAVAAVDAVSVRSVPSGGRKPPGSQRARRQYSAGRRWSTEPGGLRPPLGNGILPVVGVSQTTIVSVQRQASSLSDLCIPRFDAVDGAGRSPLLGRLFAPH